MSHTINKTTDIESDDERMACMHQALDALRHGKMVLLTDDSERENEADFIASAKTVTHEQLNIMRKEGSGIICVAIDYAKAKELRLPFMVEADKNSNLQKTAFTVSVEARQGITTGVSIEDRLTTIRLFADPDVCDNDFVRPGHVFPLVAHENGLLGRKGHTEGSLALLALAGDESPAVICEAMDENGQSLRGIDLEIHAREHSYCIISIDDIIWYQKQIIKQPMDFVETKLPTQLGELNLRVYQFLNQPDITVLSSLSFGDLKSHQPLLVRLHSSCLTGDIFASQRCDCGEQLKNSMGMIQEKGGLVMYLNQEGRGIGLFNKIKAYALQDQGFDTGEANIQLGLAVDDRNYQLACDIIKSLGIESVNLITNNPDKVSACVEYGLKVHEQVTLPSTQYAANKKYLFTKVNKLNHSKQLILE